MNDFRSGFIAIIGRPNVGKSTLVNALLGQKIAAVSPKPQTTRRRQLGILTTEKYQLVFVDTPGMHNVRNKLGNFLNQEAENSLAGVDAVLWLVDSSVKPTDEDKQIGLLLSKLPRRTPLVIAANKMDLIPAEALTRNLEVYQASVKRDANSISISATHGSHLDLLVELLVSFSPFRAPDYDEDQVTDSFERDIAADLIREACLNHLRDEVPHGVGVRIDEFKERDNGMIYIGATIFIERESQKGIVIGHKGSVLKQVGIAVREQLPEGAYLELFVKVDKDWQRKAGALDRLGF